MISAQALEAVTAEELSRAANVFAEMKNLRMKLTDAKEEVLDAAFETHVHSVMEKLDERLPSLDNEYAKVAEVTLATHGLFDASFLQAITLCQSIAPVLGEAVKELRLINFSFLMQLQESLLKAAKSEQALLEERSALHDQIADLESRCGTLEIENEDSSRSCKLLETRIAELEAAAQAALEASASQNAIPNPAERQKRVFGHPLDFKVGSNKNGNNNVANNLVSPRANASPLTPTSMNTSSVSLSSSHNKGQSSHQQAKPTSPREKSKDSQGPVAPLTSAQKLSIFRVEIQKAIDEQRCRYITLNETIELIEKLYESKVICNEKARSGVGGIPIETMEQHVYRQMEKKYGLRSLAIEHSGNFIFALQRFQYQSNDVATFYKIFCNVVEEDFNLTMKELRRSIRDLLMVQVMTRHPTKDQSVLNQLLENKMNSYIVEDEWVDMMNYLYNETDSATICLILNKLSRDEMDQEESKRTQDSKSPLSQLMRSMSSSGGSGAEQDQMSRVSTARSKVGFKTDRLTQNSFSANNVNIFKLRFSTFLKAVLDFQLKSHEEFLELFRSAFHRLDDNTDGILDTALFYQCFASTFNQMIKPSLPSSGKSGGNPSNNPDMSLNVFNKLSINGSPQDPSDAESAELMNLFEQVIRIVDPLDRDVIIYSEAVTALVKIGNK